MAKKPWNRVNLPVYSISSRAGSAENMHICTYVSGVSMQPKRMMVAIYHGTRTLALVQQQPLFVLQLLAAHQYRLVNQLGKQSGHTTPKVERLRKRKLLTVWEGFSVLKDALAVMLLQPVSEMEGGDHRVYICEVVKYKNLNEGTALTLDDLRQHNMVRM